MPKEIRFSKLVQMAGKPETVTLWIKPKNNPAFMKAVKENRVVTVFQKPTGIRKDFGTIGFHQEKFAAYLVFPGRLPKFEAHIIGINYELLQESEQKRPLKKKVEPPKAIRKDFSHDGSLPTRDGIQKLKPKDRSTKKFTVKIVRSGTAKTSLTVNDKTISEAEAIALKMVKAESFKPDEIHAKATSITQT